jgi:hypothetical protein
MFSIEITPLLSHVEATHIQKTTSKQSPVD